MRPGAILLLSHMRSIQRSMSIKLDERPLGSAGAGAGDGAGAGAGAGAAAIADLGSDSSAVTA